MRQSYFFFFVVFMTVTEFDMSGYFLIIKNMRNISKLCLHRKTVHALIGSCRETLICYLMPIFEKLKIHYNIKYFMLL